MTGADARIPRGFADAEIGDRAEWVSQRPIGGPVSNPEFPISGIARGLGRDRFAVGLAETGSLPRRPVRSCLEDPVQAAE